MNKPTAAGFLGFGHAVPETVRTNDFWGAKYAASHDTRKERDITMPVDLAQVDTGNSARKVQLLAMRSVANDPFHGAKERRVADAKTKCSTLEIAAARKALERAGIEAKALDLILTWSLPPDECMPSNAGILQHALGATRANTLGVDSACASFMSAVAIARAMIRDGQARYVLISMCAIHSRLLDFEDPASVNFGDGAGAVVMGPVAEGYGIVETAFRTYGELNEAICLGPVDDAPWYEGGSRLLVHSRKMAQGRKIVMKTAEYAVEAIGAVLDRARLTPSAITHYYSHQPVSWFNLATRMATGLGHARTVDSFPTLGGMSAANIPVNLSLAQDANQLKDGDLAVLYACGAGFVWAAAVMRWGGQAR
ncbi:MAG: hypothetical protein K1X89_11525 [Myxococcaceae bacterium]|nr:hypothetical protein [Myxococcaceae bacterium]